MITPFHLFHSHPFIFVSIPPIPTFTDNIDHISILSISTTPKQSSHLQTCRLRFRVVKFSNMEAESCVPPGFRFHPTEEELVGYYLRRKINSKHIDLDVITDIDLYRIEPWDLQDRCKLGYEDRNEWYFFSHKDKKYPTGTRTNRATAAGFWKATGRDKAVLSNHKIIGMRKTLVFYKGRAPNGNKTDWIMHEYRLQTSENAPPQDEGWVVCRAFKKPTPSHRQRVDAWNHSYYLWDQNEHAQLGTSSSDVTISPLHHPSDPRFSHLDNHQLIEPKCTSNPNYDLDASESGGDGQYIDWKAVDKLLASQLTEIASSTPSGLPTSYDNYDVNQGNNLLDYFTNL